MFECGPFGEYVHEGPGNRSQKSCTCIHVYVCVCVCVCVCICNKKILQPLSKVSYEEMIHMVNNANNMHVQCVCYKYHVHVNVCICMCVCVRVCVYVCVHESPGCCQRSNVSEAKEQMMTRHPARVFSY